MKEVLLSRSEVAVAPSAKGRGIKSVRYGDA